MDDTVIGLVSFVIVLAFVPLAWWALIDDDFPEWLDDDDSPELKEE